MCLTRYWSRPWPGLSITGWVAAVGADLARSDCAIQPGGITHYRPGSSPPSGFPGPGSWSGFLVGVPGRSSWSRKLIPSRAPTVSRLASNPYPKTAQVGEVRINHFPPRRVRVPVNQGPDPTGRFLTSPLVFRPTKSLRHQPNPSTVLSAKNPCGHSLSFNDPKPGWRSHRDLHPISHFDQNQP